MSIKAIVYDKPGDESVLQEANIPVPELKTSQVRIQVEATGINRAELLQRAGHYRLPPGTTSILGLEAAGKIIEVGSEVTRWKGGERVMALLNGGGYCEQAVAEEGHVLSVPSSFSIQEAAGFMETTLTAFLNVFQIGGASPGGSVLIHGGGSGVGTQAIALCKAKQITTFVTAGSDEKCARCAKAGASFVINYKTESFAEVVKESTKGRGVDVILDCVGGPYLQKDLTCLALDGTLVFIGLMNGAIAEKLDLGIVMGKRATIVGSTLRSRSVPFKTELVANLQEQFGKEIRDGSLKPIIDSVLPLSDVADGHRRMASNKHFGKIILSVSLL